MGLINNLAKTVATVGKRSAEGYFNQRFWEENYSSVLEAQVNKAGNAGQESILTGDFFDGGTEYCSTNGEDYNPDGFVSYLENYLGDSKYNAISQIIEETSIELQDAWDGSYAGDGVGQKMYGSMEPRIIKGFAKRIDGKIARTTISVSNGVATIKSQSISGISNTRNVGRRLKGRY